MSNKGLLIFSVAVSSVALLGYFGSVFLYGKSALLEESLASCRHRADAAEYQFKMCKFMYKKGCG